jgi:hypothetical protein
MSKIIRDKKRKISKGRSATPWRFDKASNTFVSVPTGEVIFELNIHPRSAQDMSNVRAIIAAINSKKGGRKAR